MVPFHSFSSIKTADRGQVDVDQGDQIGRFSPNFDCLLVFTFLKNIEIANIVGLLFSTDCGCALILTKKHWLGFILGDFLVYSSGHPDAHATVGCPPAAHHS
jgi:hypothetical protein